MNLEAHRTNDTIESLFNRSCYENRDLSQYGISALTLAGLLMNLDFVVVAGNLLVLLAFAIDRHLRTPTHYFIGSLAAADLALGILVLPFAIAFEVAGAWPFGITLCQLWLAVDVWLCTASIYGLIMVGIDRYIAVTRPLAYRSFMTRTRASLMIASAWTISLVICLPTFVFSSYRASKALESSCQCTQMIHGPVYIVYSAVGSFYLPMAIIGYVYVRIYVTVRRIKLQGVSGVVNIDLIDEKSDGKENSIGNGDVCSTRSWKLNCRKSPKLVLSRNASTRATMRVHKGRYKEDNTTPLLSRNRSERSTPPPRKYLYPPENRFSPASGYMNPNFEPAFGHKRKLRNRSSALSVLSSPGSSSVEETSQSGERRGLEQPRSTSATSFTGFMAVHSHITSMWYERMDTFHKYHQKFTHELGALRTVGIVTGCFVACWFGFCVVYTMHAWPQCKLAPEGDTSRKCVPNWVVSLMVWFGYANSAINPIIYTASNENFRRAFRALLRCEVIRKRPI